MYLLKLAFRAWRIAPLSQMFSAIAVGFLLLLIGFLFWMQQGLKPVLIRLQKEQVVTAYLNSSATETDEARLLEEVKQLIGSESSAEIRLVTSSQFIQMMKDQYSDLGRELEDLGQDKNQVIPRYISVSGVLNHSVIDQIKKLEGIESAESSKDRYHHIVGAFSTLRFVAKVLMIGVILALLTGLIHLSRMNVYLHQDALSLMKLWGASGRILSTPGMISGLFVGMLGGVIASSGWLTIGYPLTHHIRALSSILKGLPIVRSHFAIALLLMGSGVGLLSGFLGSLSIFRVNSSGGLGD